ncbi:MAG TPA: transposase [Coleofasciculaceae cyanobacterium]|jgi:hypothetical protein
MANHRTVAPDRTSYWSSSSSGFTRDHQWNILRTAGGVFKPRALPHDLPPWQTVYNYFRHWQRLGVWQKIHTQLRQQVRKSVEKTDNPTAGIIDSQSVKTAEKRGKCTVTMAANEVIAT